MPYLKNSPVKRVTLPTDENYWVELKTRLDYGSRLRATGAMMRVSTVNLNEVPIEKTSQVRPSDDGETGVLTEMELDAFLLTQLSEAIADWNLTDENDQRLPITEESVRLLDGDDGQFLTEKVRELLGGGRARGPFEKPSQRPSEATIRRSGTRPKLVAPSNAS